MTFGMNSRTFDMKKFRKYFSNILLVAIVLILLVPSWRVTFQGWFQGLFLSSTDFRISRVESIPMDVMSWEITDMEGHTFSFSSLNDKPILISFWATWCPPCRAELPEIKSLNDNLGDDIHFIAVSEESIETIKNSGLHNDYSFLFRTNYYPRFFEVSAYPTLCIINNQMELIHKQEGAGKIDTEKNNQFLRGLIENK